MLTRRVSTHTDPASRHDPVRPGIRFGTPRLCAEFPDRHPQPDGQCL